MTRSPRGPYFRKTRSSAWTRLPGLDVEHLEALDVTLGLEDPRDLYLEP